MVLSVEWLDKVLKYFVKCQEEELIVRVQLLQESVCGIVVRS